MYRTPLKENIRAILPMLFRGICRQWFGTPRSFSIVQDDGNKRDNKPKDTLANHGQGVLEFVVVSVSIIFFILMFVNLSYLFLVGEYIDYAVFMAARSLYAGHRTYEGSCSPGHPEPTQQCFAQLTLNSLLKMDSGGAFGPLVKFRNTSEQAVRARAKYPTPKNSENSVVGVKVEYEVPLFLMPPLGILKQQDTKTLSRVQVVSETYLDREPTQDECYEQLRKIAEDLGTIPDPKAVSKTEAEDNGC